MRLATASDTVHHEPTVMAGAASAETAVVVPGTLADVTTAARLIQSPTVIGTDDAEREALLRLALAHVALSSGGLWLVRRGTTMSAAALLPPGSHPDIAAMSWTAKLQLHLAPPSDRGPREAHLLLPPRHSAGAVDLVRTVLSAAPAGDVVAPAPQDSGVAAVLGARGFSMDQKTGLLRRRATVCRAHPASDEWLRLNL